MSACRHRKYRHYMFLVRDSKIGAKMITHDTINQALAEEFNAESIHWIHRKDADWYRWKFAKGYKFIGLSNGKLYARRGIPWGLGDIGICLCDLADPNLIEYLKKELQDESRLEF